MPAQSQDAEYPSLPLLDPTWPAAAPDWTGPHWEMQQRSHSAQDLEKRTSWWSCWYDFWSCLKSTNKSKKKKITILFFLFNSPKVTFLQIMNDIKLLDWLSGSSGFRTWETRTDVSSLRSSDWLCLDWTRWTATVALRAAAGWDEFKFVWWPHQNILIAVYERPRLLPTCLIWCSAWCAGRYRNIISVSLAKFGFWFMLLYQCNPRLWLHFLEIGSASLGM